MGHTLIIRSGALGDAVLTMPVLHAAGAERLTILGMPASWAFLRPDAVAVRDFGGAQWMGLMTGELGPAARALVADVEQAIVLLSGHTEPAVAALEGAGVRDVVVRTPPPRDARGGPHAAERLLGGPVPTVPPTLADDPLLAPSGEDHAGALAAFGHAAKPEPLFVLHPGSGGPAKCWPADRYAALALRIRARFGVDPVVLIGPADHSVQRAFDAALPANTVMLHFAGRPLRQVLALLAGAAAFVGNDAGPTHLAARACPTLALFGPTDPAVWRPLGRRVAVLAAAGGDMAALSVDMVWQALARLADSGAAVSPP